MNFIIVFCVSDDVEDVWIWKRMSKLILLFIVFFKYLNFFGYYVYVFWRRKF